MTSLTRVGACKYLQTYALDLEGEQMSTQPLGSGSNWTASPTVYNRSYLPAALRAGLIALVLAVLLLIVIL